MRFVSAVILLAFSFQPISNAEPAYRPFVFKDQNLNSRADIQELLPKLQIERSALKRSHILPFELQRMHIEMLADVGEILASMAEPTPPIAKFSAPAQAHCAAIIAQTSKPLQPAMASATQCASQTKPTTTVFDAALLKSCLYAFEPEKFVEEQPSGKLSEDQLHDMEGLILTAGEGLSHLQYPESLFDQKKMDQMRIIIAKLRLEKLLQNLKSQQNKLANLIKQSSESSCQDKSQPSSLAFSQVLSLIQSELNGAQLYLLDLKKSGLAQAALDRQTVEKLGRKRGDLPMAWITDQERTTLSTWLMGIFWRMRGGGILKAKGTQEARTFFAQDPVETIAKFNCGTLCDSEPRQMGSSTYWALVWKGWSKWLAMGRSAKGEDEYGSIVKMTDRGLYQVEELENELRDSGFETDDLHLAGLQFGICYDYSWELLGNASKHNIGADLKTPYIGFMDGPTSWAEVCVGGALGAGISRSLLNGVRK